MTALADRHHGNGRPARRLASSGCCARRRCPIGLLVNQQAIRLVYAPARRDSSGISPSPSRK